MNLCRNFISVHFLVPLFLLLSNSVSAEVTIKETLIYKHFVEEDGLTTKTVYVMMQDRFGFIWFATDAGVYRYDGKIFKHFTMRDGLSDNEVMNLAEDSKGRIWFLTFNGKLSYWYNGKIYNENQTHFLKNAFLGQLPSTFYEDTKGRIWIGCKMAGLIIIDDTVVTKMTSPGSIREFVGPYIFEGEDNSIRYFHKDKLINLTTKDTLTLNGSVLLFSPTENKKGGYYSTYNGIFYTDGISEKRILDMHVPLDDRSIINLVCVGNYVWLCKLGNGVFRIDNMGNEYHYLENSNVINVLRDREGNLWFSTIDDGVYMLSQNKSLVRNFDVSSGLSDNRVISITKDDNRSLWLGYSNGKIDRISDSKITTYNMRRKSDPEYLKIRVLKYKNDTIWSGDDSGLKFIYNEKVNYIQYSEKLMPTSPYTVKDIYFNRNKQIYLCIHKNILVVEKDRSGFFVRELADSLFRTFSLTQLNDYEFLVSTMHGLIVYCPGKYSYPFFSDSVFNSIRTIDMEFDRDSLLFLATIDKGLFIVKGKNIIQHLTSAEGLTDDNCRRLCITDNEIFLATSNGVTVLSKGDKRNWSVKKTITINDGIISNIINDIVVIDSNIYLATDKGLSVVPKKIESNFKFKTRVVITEIVTDGNQNPFDTSFSVSANIPRVLIRYAYPVFDQSNRTSYEYRLTGKNYRNADWVQTTNTEVEFSSLIPGEYYFEIKPSSEKNNGTTKISLIILPKWWQTWWAKVLFFLTISFILFFILRLRFRIQYEKLRLIESERRRIASDMHDDIGSDLTQISLWMNILKSYELKENKIVQKLSVLSEEVLSKMGQIIWALDSMHNSSNDLFTFIREYFSKTLEPTSIKFDYTLSENMTERIVSSFQRRNIFLVLKELLNNSIKHSRAETIGVNIDINGNVVSIKYFDDGIGFDLKNDFNGHGLKSMKRRIQEINGEITIESIPQKGFICNIRVLI